MTDELGSKNIPMPTDEDIRVTIVWLLKELQEMTARAETAERALAEKDAEIAKLRADIPAADWSNEDRARYDYAGLLHALSQQRQIDGEGAEVAVSRQAADEAIGAITSLRQQLKSKEKAVRGWMAENAPGGWIDELRIDRDLLHDMAAKYLQRAETEEAALATCQGERDAVSVDAHRYQWLRDIGPFRSFGHCVADSDGDIVTGPALDSAIDAAIRASKEAAGGEAK